MNNFKQLTVWQKAMDLAEIVYDLCRQLPKEERYALADQLKRAVVSIPSNIAEGQKRLNSQEAIQFSGIALGSTAEVETRLLLAQRLHKIDVRAALVQTEEITRMLVGLIKSLRK